MSDGRTRILIDDETHAKLLAARKQQEVEIARAIEQKVAQWIRDHVQYHPGADGVLLEAIADGILEGLYNQASAKVAGHDYVYEMECGWCDGTGELAHDPNLDRLTSPRHCHACESGRVRVRRRQFAVDHCRVCGESPDSGIHAGFDRLGRASHNYVPPWAGPGVAG